MLRERRKHEDLEFLIPSELEGETIADISGSLVRDMSIEVLRFCERITPTLLSGLAYLSQGKELGISILALELLRSKDSELEVLEYLPLMTMFFIYLENIIQSRFQKYSGKT